MATRSMLATIVLVLVLSGAGHAQPPFVGTLPPGIFSAVLFTSPLDPFTLSDEAPPDYFFQCHIVNISDTDLSVRIRVVSSDGVTVDDSGSVPLVAGTVRSRNVRVGSVFPFDPPDVSYCRFDVFGMFGNARSVRANGAVFKVGFGYLAILPAQ